MCSSTAEPGVSDTLVVRFTLNHQSIKGAFAIAQSVREQRPDIRIFPLPTRIDGSEEKLLNRMKTYAADLFTPLLDKKIRASEIGLKWRFRDSRATHMLKSFPYSKNRRRSPPLLDPPWSA